MARRRIPNAEAVSRCETLRLSAHSRDRPRSARAHACRGDVL